MVRRLCLLTQEIWGTKIPHALWPKNQNTKQKFNGKETCGHSGRKRVGERVHGNIYIIICKIDSQWEFAV